eukprot:4316980-Prymnesium_polylepis.1
MRREALAPSPSEWRIRFVCARRTSLAPIGVVHPTVRQAARVGEPDLRRKVVRQDVRAAVARARFGCRAVKQALRRDVKLEAAAGDAAAMDGELTRQSQAAGGYCSGGWWRHDWQACHTRQSGTSKPHIRVVDRGRGASTTLRGRRARPPRRRPSTTRTATAPAGC